MQSGWVRLSRTCQNACSFCDDADELDGKAVSLEQIQADVDAAVDAGCGRIVFSGGEPTMNRQLLAAIRYAKGKGLETSLSTNARIIQSDKIATMLEKAGLDEIVVAVHGGRRSSHDQLVGSDGAWVESLAGLRFAGKTGMRVVCRSVLNTFNTAELSYLMHLVMMGGASGMEVRRVHRGGKVDKELYPQLSITTAQGVDIVSTLWTEAKEEQLLLTATGFDNSMDEGLKIVGEPGQADRAALAMLRQRIQLHHAFHGLTCIDVHGMGKDFTALLGDHGGLAAVGLELEARYAPLLDAPPCVGGRALDPQMHGDAATYGPDCDDCPVRPSCGGMHRKFRKVLEGQLRPRAAWTGVGEGATIVVLGGTDPILRDETLPDLAAALTDAGAVIGDDPATADLVVCGDAATARGLRDQGVTTRLVVLDADLGVGLDGLDGALIESFAPGKVDSLLSRGVDLRDVRFRPCPVPASCAGLEEAPEDAPIVAFGKTTHWRLFAGAARLCGPSAGAIHAWSDQPQHLEHLPAVTVFDPSDTAGLRAAIEGARAVVFAPKRGRDQPEYLRALAEDLRWLSYAVACGKPVVAARGVAVEDHVRHDVTGFLTRARDPNGLKTGLIGVRSRSVRYGAAARELGLRASPAAWAHDLIHGSAPGWDHLTPTPPRRWPLW